MKGGSEVLSLAYVKKNYYVLSLPFLSPSPVHREGCDSGQVVHTYVPMSSLTKQYKLVPAQAGS